MRQDALQISETAARQDADIYYSMMPDLQQISTLDVKKNPIRRFLSGYSERSSCVTENGSGL